MPSYWPERFLLKVLFSPAVEVNAKSAYRLGREVSKIWKKKNSFPDYN
jgi:hypothetical protein